MTLIEMLEKHGACYEAKEWAKAQDCNLYNAWRKCQRGDWLLWMAAKLGIERKLIVAAACDCAETYLKYAPEGEERPANAIRVARAWIAGDASIAEVRDAASDAYDAAASHAAHAAYAAYAADAAYAAYAAAHAAAYAGKTHKEMATLVRQAIPWTAWKDAIAKGEDQ